MRSRLRIYALPILLSFHLAVGCTIDKEYVKADRLTYLAIAPEYVVCLETHGATPAHKRRGLRTIETWAFRLRKAGADTEAIGPLVATPTARTSR